MSKILTIEEMQNIAKSRRGLCLSEKYINARTKLKWKCEKDHIWEAEPDNIKQGRWCPRCAGKGKTIQDMQNIAKSHGGKCLSEEYINDKTHLLWQCNKEHTWKSTPSNAERGRWCPYCCRFKKKSIININKN